LSRRAARVALWLLLSPARQEGVELGQPVHLTSPSPPSKSSPIEWERVSVYPGRRAAKCMDWCANGHVPKERPSHPFVRNMARPPSCEKALSFNRQPTNHPTPIPAKLTRAYLSPPAGARPRHSSRWRWRAALAGGPPVHGRALPPGLALPSLQASRAPPPPRATRRLRGRPQLRPRARRRRGADGRARTSPR